MRKARRADYVYDGFRHPIHRITGDAYREILGMQPDRSDKTRVFWDPVDDELLLEMTLKDTFVDIANLCGCEPPVARRRYKQLQAEGLVPPRGKVFGNRFTPEEDAIIHENIQTMSTGALTRLLPNRHRVTIMYRVKHLGYIYDHKIGRWVSRDRVAA